MIRHFHLLLGITLGALLGVLMLIAGGLIPPAPSQCPGCAVLNANVPVPASAHCYVEVVVGGKVCT